MGKRPHIVLFHPDQWRGDVLGHLGNEGAVTPNLDRLVERDAVSFRYAYCQSPVCTPSRCSIMTGWYPHVRGHRTMHHMLRPEEPMLLRTLKECGYFVWWGGKNDVVPAQHGFGAYCDVKHRAALHAPSAKPPRGWRGEPGSDTYYSFYVGRLDKGEESFYPDSDWGHVLAAIDLIRNRPEDRPLCIYLPLSYPHPPYGVEEPWFSLIDRGKLPPRIPAPRDWSAKPSMLRGLYERLGMQGWSEERWQELRATYYGMCARVDHQFGLVVEALRAEGIYDETAIFFFSDHGDFTGDYGLVEKAQNTFEECLVRVPFVVKPPAEFRAKPGVSEAMVELIDLPATVEALAKIQPAHTHFGRSLLPILAGETQVHRDAVFCEGGRLPGETHCMERESNPDLDPEDLYWPRMSLQRSDGPEHLKAVMCRTKEYKYVRRLGERDELYDLRTDPHQLENRIDDPALKPVLETMRERLLDWYMETCDVVPHDPDRR